jgi:hypothetical protein
MTKPLAAGCLLASLLSATAAAQPIAASIAERLTLDTAVRLAVEHNRQVASARLQVDSAADAVATARTRTCRRRCRSR